MTDRELLREQWREAAQRLSVAFIAPFFLKLPNGRSQEFAALLPEFAALLPEFGAVQGMLVDTEFNREVFAFARAARYGISIMGAEKRLPFNIDGYISCLVDWGWANKDQPPPTWYKNDA